MEIVKQQIQLTLNKTEFVELVMECMLSENAGALKRALQPTLVGKFPQFPTFNQITLGAINLDNLSVNVSLRIKKEIEAKDEEEKVEEEVA